MVQKIPYGERFLKKIPYATKTSYKDKIGNAIKENFVNAIIQLLKKNKYLKSAKDILKEVSHLEFKQYREQNNCIKQWVWKRGIPLKISAEILS